MTHEQLVNAGWYLVYAVVGALVATGVALGLALSGTDDIAWRPLAAIFVNTLFGTLATAVATSQLTRVGSEGLAQDVDVLRAAGYHRADMRVTVPNEPLPPIQLTQVVDEIERRIRAMSPPGGA